MKRTTISVAAAVASSTVVLSMVLNSWAFTASLNTWFGHALGVLVPLWVLGLTFLGHALWTSKRELSIGCYSLAGFALLVSLPHLASGYGRLGLQPYECWSLALVTDLAQVFGKLTVISLVGAPAVAAKVSKRKGKKIKLAA